MYAVLFDEITTSLIRYENVIKATRLKRSVMKSSRCPFAARLLTPTVRAVIISLLGPRH